jgi:hypothetical protein
MGNLYKWLIVLPRWPEVVTHEEMNLKPPGSLMQVILRMRSKGEDYPSLLSALRSIGKPERQDSTRAPE